MEKIIDTPLKYALKRSNCLFTKELYRRSPAYASTKLCHLVLIKPWIESTDFPMFLYKMVAQNHVRTQLSAIFKSRYIPIICPTISELEKNGRSPIKLANHFQCISSLIQSIILFDI